MPKSGDLVEAILAEDPKSKGRRFARHERSGLLGSILNPDQVPADKHLGDNLTLLVASISSDGKQIQFRVPSEADLRKAQSPSSPPTNRGPRRPFGRR